LKNVPGTRPVRFSNSVTFIFSFGERGEQRAGVEVALDGGAIADIHPGLVDVDAPVDTHHVAAAAWSSRKKPAAPVPK